MERERWAKNREDNHCFGRTFDISVRPQQPSLRHLNLDVEFMENFNMCNYMCLTLLFINDYIF